MRDGLANCFRGLQKLRIGVVRFLYAYPNRVTQGLLDALAAARAARKIYGMRCSTRAGMYWRG